MRVRDKERERQRERERERERERDRDRDREREGERERHRERKLKEIVRKMSENSLIIFIIKIKKIYMNHTQSCLRTHIHRH